MTSIVQRMIFTGQAQFYKPPPPPAPAMLAVMNADRETYGTSGLLTRDMVNFVPTRLPLGYPIRIAYDGSRQGFCLGYPDRIEFSANGMDWNTPVPLPAGVNAISDICIGTFGNGGRLVLLNNGGAWYTDNLGLTWTKSNLPSPLVSPNTAYNRVINIPYHNRIYCLATGTRHYYSNDGGATWTALAVLSSSAVWHQAIHHEDPAMPGRVVLMANRAGNNYCRLNDGLTPLTVGSVSSSLVVFTADKWRNGQQVISSQADSGDDVWFAATTTAGTGQSFTKMTGMQNLSIVKYVPAVDALFAANAFGNIRKRTGTAAPIDVTFTNVYWRDMCYGPLVNY